LKTPALGHSLSAPAVVIYKGSGVRALGVREKLGAVIIFFLIKFYEFPIIVT